MPVQITRQKANIERQKAGITRNRARLRKPDEPDLDSMFEEAEIDPIDIETGDFQNDLTETVAAELSAVKEQIAAARERFRLANDDRFYFCVCFQNVDQKEEFLRRMGWDDLGLDFLNGLEVARRLGQEIPYVSMKPLPLRGNAKRYEGLTLQSK